MKVDDDERARGRRRIRLIRDGTIFGPGGTEIDLRTEDYKVWVTVKGDKDRRVEEVAAAILAGAVEDGMP
jgi:hypothetical protein